MAPYTMTEHKIMLDNLRKNLFGHYSLVAKKSGVSVAAVSRILRGDFVNWEVINCAAETLREIQKEESRKISHVKKILES